MRNRILILCVLVLSIFLIIVSSKWHTTFFMLNGYSKNIKVKDNIKNEITNMELEDYIIGVVAAEMPASFQMDALKAQAVAARSYAI